jgi:predicted ATPase
MKFTLKNLGIFEKKATIELGDLTIICGNNNTGKTYASYAIFILVPKFHLGMTSAQRSVARLGQKKF